MASITHTADFDGHVTVVTGAGRGLGRAHALLLASLGATVVVSDAGVAPDGSGADPQPAEAVTREINDAGGIAVASAADLRSRTACRQLIEQTVQRFGRLDALVHSAGIVDRTELNALDENKLALTLAVNVNAALWLCQAALPAMEARRYGRIVLTISGYGLMPTDPPSIPAYAIAKASQFGLMNALAAQSAARGVLINAVAPVAATRVYTGADADRYAPEHVSPGVAFLASHRCRDYGIVLRAAGGEFSIGGYAVTEGVRFAVPPKLSTFTDRWPEITRGPLRPVHPVLASVDQEKGSEHQGRS